MDVINKLLVLIKNQTELENALSEINCHINTTYQQCLKLCTKPKLNVTETDILRIESVVDYLHEELNTGHWSDVAISLRRSFTAASFVKAILILYSNNKIENVEKTIKCIDMGILLGAPLAENSDLLTQSASLLMQQMKRNDENNTNNAVSKKRKQNEYNNFNCLSGLEIDTLDCPSLEQFDKLYFQLQQPVKLKGCISHWPALTRWNDVNYLLNIAGERTVPVEIGSHYVDENWSQKLMPLKEFIKQYYLQESSDIGYLAQHNLFDQITELKNDIRVPEYCCLSKDYENSNDVDINAWFGPEGTVSPLHYDPKDNLLAQVFGTKQILLFSPEDTGYLYPHEGRLLSNTAQVDPLKPNFGDHPEFKKAKMFKCLLEAGEIVFIPSKWWHHVMSLEKSFSVSFWWQ